MSEDKRIHIDRNSDCYGEIEQLKEMLKKSRHYTNSSGEWKDSDIVAVAIDELYDRVVKELKGNQKERPAMNKPVKYYDYEVKYTGPDGETWVAYPSGKNRREAIAHFNYWQNEGERLGDDLPVLSIRSQGSSTAYPYLLEDALEAALKDKSAAIRKVKEYYGNIVSKLESSEWTDHREAIRTFKHDCRDLVTAIKSADHGALPRLDTMVRDAFIEIMLGLDTVKKAPGEEIDEEKEVPCFSTI